jgi:Rieske Fe-S protein
MLAGQGIIIVRPEESRYVALASKCTHGGVIVTYNHRKGFLQCNSFGHSIFMLDGSVEKGPAKRPLKVYPVTVDNGRLEIEL